MSIGGRFTSAETCCGVDPGIDDSGAASVACFTIDDRPIARDQLVTSLVDAGNLPSADISGATAGALPG